MKNQQQETNSSIGIDRSAAEIIFSRLYREECAVCDIDVVGVAESSRLYREECAVCDIDVVGVAESLLMRCAHVLEIGTPQPNIIVVRSNLPYAELVDMVEQTLMDEVDVSSVSICEARLTYENFMCDKEAFAERSARGKKVGSFESEGIEL